MNLKSLILCQASLSSLLIENICGSTHLTMDSLCREQARDRKRDVTDSGIVEKAFRPVFKSVPQSQTVREGTCVRFDCIVSARPQAEVNWYRNGQLITQDNMHKVCTTITSMVTIVDRNVCCL